MNKLSQEKLATRIFQHILSKFPLSQVLYNSINQDEPIRRFSSIPLLWRKQGKMD